jgi:predicted ATP-dependent serine protease
LLGYQSNSLSLLHLIAQVTKHGKVDHDGVISHLVDRSSIVAKRSQETMRKGRKSQNNDEMSRSRTYVVSAHKHSRLFIQSFIRVNWVD